MHVHVAIINFWMLDLSVYPIAALIPRVGVSIRREGMINARWTRLSGCCTARNSRKLGIDCRRDWVQLRIIRIRFVDSLHKIVFKTSLTISFDNLSMDTKKSTKVRADK